MKICPNCRQTYPTNFVLCPQDGQTLKEVIQNEGPMAVTRACRIAKNAAAAVDAAHALGMVHRDIKPSNIALVETASGEEAKVLDFGIAKVKEGLLEDSKLKHMTLTGTGAGRAQTPVVWRLRSREARMVPSGPQSANGGALRQPAVCSPS